MNQHLKPASDLIPKQNRSVYHELIGRKKLWLFGLGIGLGALVIADIMIGPAWLSPKEVLLALFSEGENLSQNHVVIVRVIRLPVALMALVVGAALGVAGAQMQTVLNNPLASPYTLGLSAAASFGAALAIVLCKEMAPSQEVIIVPLGAFLFSLLCALLLFLLARTRQVSVHTIILAGVALSFLFNALLSLTQYFAKDNQFEAIVLWMFGSLQSATWQQVLLVGIALAICLPVFLFGAWKYMALRLGEDKAKSMGIRADGLRLQTILLASLLTAVSVCFVGAIGFVGLVAPHLARALMGEDQRFYIPAAALLGAVMLSFASIVSKCVVPGAVFPIGITTSLIGIPFLLMIILKRK